MNKLELRRLIETEIRTALNESEFELPSEQILKGALKIFKQRTGISLIEPTVTKERYDSILYSVNLDKEIRTPVMKNLFKSLSLQINCYPLTNKIGGYSFRFSFSYKHPSGGSNGIDILDILYYDNKFH